MPSEPNPRRQIPSVDALLGQLEPLALPRPVAVQAIRAHLAEIRAGSDVPPPDEILEQARERLTDLRRERIQPVINATGVLLHTNLGRAPLSPKAAEFAAAIAAQYSSLELDLASGRRGKRGRYLESLLATLVDAEACTVVNNCAAALVLALKALCSGERREVIVSRGELVQIGGGFRIPEILEAAGAILREVGATNQTTIADYARAIGPRTALILKVHRSNFTMDGFVASPTREALVTIAREHELPLVEDLGSGAIEDFSQWHGLPQETQPQTALKAGVDLVCFSGDKLFGGPQAGLLAGSTERVTQLKAHPFFRAVRCDKLVLAALQTVVEDYLANNSEAPTPLIEMLTQPLATLQARAEAIVAASKIGNDRISIDAHTGRIGGGALPQTEFPSLALSLRPNPKQSLEALAATFRAGPTPILGVIERDRFKLDLRTILPDQDAAVADALHSRLAS